MAVGLAAVLTTEIEFSSGTWTDVSAYTAAERGMTGTFGRSTEFEDCSPATWRVVLRNDDGRFTPDNPLSPYFPNVVENIRLRVTATKAGTPYRRFFGYVTAIEPSFPESDAFTSQVTISAADTISALARRSTATGWAEQANWVARYNSAWNDLFVFPSDSSTASTFQNSGNPVAGVTQGSAKILTSATAAGSWQVGSPDADLHLDGQLTLTPSGTVGPVLKVQLGGSPNQLDFFLNVPTDTTVANGAVGLPVLDVWSETGGLFSLRLYWDATLNQVHLGYYNNAANTWIGTISGTASWNITKINDGVWRKITLFDLAARSLGPGVGVNIDDLGGGSYMPWGGAPAFTGATRLIFGGTYGGPSRESKTSNCPLISIAGVNVEQTDFGVYSWVGKGAPPACSAMTRFTELCGYAGSLVGQKKGTLTFTASSTTVTSATPFFTSDDVGKGLLGSPNRSSVTVQPFMTTLVPWQLGTTIASVQSPTSATLSKTASSSLATATVLGPAITGALDRWVVRVQPDDSGDLAEAFANLARTVGGVFWVQPDGDPELIMPDAMRSTTVIASVDVEADIDGGSVRPRRSVEARPTQVTVQTPNGNVVVVDSTALAQARRDVTVSTGAGTDTLARSIAGYYLTASQTLRIPQVTVTLGTAQADLYAAFLGSLKPGARLRLTNLPSAVLGRTWADLYVQGWQEVWTKDEVDFTFDLTPADDPVEGIAGDAEYGRVASDSSLTLAFPITSGATGFTLAQAVGPGTKTTGLMTTASGDYPLDLDLLGERVTCSAAPSSSSRTNLVTNPSFETNITGWSVSAGSLANLLVVSGLQVTSAYVGTRVLQVGWPTVGALGASLSYAATGLTIGQTYAFSVYVWVPAGAGRVRIADNTGTATGVSYPTRADGTSMQDSGGTTGAWVRLGMVFTAAATSHNLGLKNLDAWTNGQLVFADAALLEQTANGVSSYFDGSAGGSWTGTAHASTSTLPIQTFASVTRGVAPTVARAHLGAEIIRVWHEAAAAF